MRWNWQQPDWPHFQYEKGRLEQQEASFLHSSGVLAGAIKHLDVADGEQLKVELISNEAVKTSEIEGEILNRESIQSSIRKEFGLKTDARRIAPAEQGIAEMMVNLYRTFDQPLSHEILFEWHRMLSNGRRDLTDIGRYRTHSEPMQVVSGRLDEPKVHFETLSSSAVPKEMDQFIAWINRTAPKGPEPLPALARSGIAHFYFVSIHPFEDGNGRIGRAIAEKTLAQCLGEPTLIALVDQIERTRKFYYNALEEANKDNRITPWLLWFAKTVIDAQRFTQARIEFLIEKTKLLDRLRGLLNARQEKALMRMFREGPAGFKGGLSAEKYINITKASPATATRDLSDLVEKGALIRAGERRHTRYSLNLASVTPI